MSDKRLDIPSVPNWASGVGWFNFFVTISFVIASLAVQGSGADGGGVALAKFLQAAFPWVLLGAMAFAAGFTYFAATGFGGRLGAIKEMLRGSKPGKKENHYWVTLAKGDLRFQNNAGTSLADKGPQVRAKGLLVPQPFDGIEGTEFVVDLTDYLDLLSQERTSARATAGKLAAALGGAFATGVLAYGRLVDFMNQAPV